MQIYSPSVKVVKHAGVGASRSYPVFSDQEKIEGRVMLDPSCSQAGRLTISVRFRAFSSLLSADRNVS